MDGKWKPMGILSNDLILKVSEVKQRFVVGRSTSLGQGLKTRYMWGIHFSPASVAVQQISSCDFVSFSVFFPHQIPLKKTNRTFQTKKTTHVFQHFHVSQVIHIRLFYYVLPGCQVAGRYVDPPNGVPIQPSGPFHPVPSAAPPRWKSWSLTVVGLSGTHETDSPGTNALVYLP